MSDNSDAVSKGLASLKEFSTSMHRFEEQLKAKYVGVESFLEEVEISLTVDHSGAHDVRTGLREVSAWIDQFKGFLNTAKDKVTKSRNFLTDMEEVDTRNPQGRLLNCSSADSGICFRGAIERLNGAGGRLEQKTGALSLTAIVCHVKTTEWLTSSICRNQGSRDSRNMSSSDLPVTSPTEEAEQAQSVCPRQSENSDEDWVKDEHL